LDREVELVGGGLEPPGDEFGERRREDDPHDHQAHQHERQRGKDHPEELRGVFPLLGMEFLGEDRDERGGERTFPQQSSEEVGHAEGRVEGIGEVSPAEHVGHHGVSDVAQ